MGDRVRLRELRTKICGEMIAHNFYR